jgi:1,4-dihydroxy-2-naphthoyl-CoA hydrolase
MSIWFNEVRLEDLNRRGAGNMVGHLGIEFIEIGDDYLKARMPVDTRTTQPAGLLHGGASVALAETIGSYAAYLCVDPRKKSCVGQEINANHLRAVRNGSVTALATALHLGSRSQVWDIRIHSEAGSLICISRLTVAVIDRLTRV